MKLSEAVDLTAALSLAALTSNLELVRDVQARLMQFGLLDPPVDGKFGSVTHWALQEFCKSSNIAFDGELTREIARALMDSDEEELFPLRPGDNLAGKVASALMRRGYWIARHRSCYNIVYVEGMDVDGTINDNKPNKFNDVRILLQLSATGVPKITKSWEATTEPGKYWTDNPMNPAGAARIAFGQYKSWAVGTHHAATPGAHEALIQVENISIYRDLNKDYKRDGDTRYTGMFAINQHWGYDMPRDDLRRSSAGCLVGRTKAGHREFMGLVKSDPRYVTNNGYRFMAAVMPATALSETSFDPASPH
ncbi:peptidoglycan-binding domain-containing protein [Tardiphaga sp.]|uniref:peptidoglycan-binding domain-containing protein n=1 Tax=Tardiphaga sp. TaxID=1926292 RepID=UPI00352B5526